MPFAIGGNARIRTNISAENAYNSLETSNRDISLRQLRLSTGKRINNAADDVSGYITSRALHARNGALRAALLAVGDANNVSNILMDSLDNIYNLLNLIKEGASTAASGAMGTDEKIALAKAAFRMAQQIQTVVDSTVFGGRQLLDGTYSADYVIGTNAKHQLITLSVDMTFRNPDYNIPSNYFDVNSMKTNNFAGVTGLDLRLLDNVSADNLGIFHDNMLPATISSLAKAIDNVNKVASLLGGIVNRLNSQEDLLKGQITNYNAAISRIEDADVAKEQLQLIKSQFLQQASLASLAQANANPQAFLQLIQR
ncbi:MAG TPA: flagellin [Candidatus Kapabacteria bacterium]|jgi:flagellin|nr:flagellin [Candidatus Kapabacteria bacterium]HPP39133.1 flagellin [Candidatus Kapabacteria bacterium]